MPLLNETSTADLVDGQSYEIEGSAAQVVFSTFPHRVRITLNNSNRFRESAEVMGQLQNIDMPLTGAFLRYVCEFCVSRFPSP